MSTVERMDAAPLKLTMVEYLTAVAEHGTDAYEVLIGLGHHPNVVMAKAEKADRRRYTDCGVSPRRGWLIQHGADFLSSQGIEAVAAY